MAMYRGDSSVTDNLSALNTQGFGTPLHNSTFNNGLGVSALSRSTPNQMQTNQIEVLANKVDQLIAMVTTTQQALFNQQGVTAKLQTELTDLQQKYSDLVSKVDNQSANAPTQQESQSRRKVPNGLSLSVKKLHEQAAEDYKFIAAELFSSDHNRKVSDFIYREVKGQFSDTYDDSTVKRGIHRYYESRRRFFNDNKPARTGKVLTNKRNAQKKAYQKRMYDRRRKFLKSENEKKQWAEIDEQFMTEESDSEEGENVLQHKLPWRSNRLSSLVAKLDSRAKEAPQSTSGRIKLKPRTESVLSISSPPQNAPSWTVDSTYRPNQPSEEGDLHTPSRQQSDTRNPRQLIPLSLTTSDIVAQL